MSKKTTLTSTRRELLIGASMVIGASAASPAFAQTPAGAPAKAKAKAPVAAKRPRLKNPNFLFIFTDQERYRATWPKGLELPAHERLQRTGTTFHKHYCPATMCTSSRSVMMTGLTTPNNGMFENCDVPYIGSLSTKIPTIGHMLRKAGYYTAYKGKWHLSRKFDVDEPERELTAWFSACDLSVRGNVTIDRQPMPTLNGFSGFNARRSKTFDTYRNGRCSPSKLRLMQRGAAQHSHASVRDLEWQDRERRTPFAVCFCNPEASRTQHHSTRKNELPRVGKRFREFFWRAIARFRKSAHTFVQNGT